MKASELMEQLIGLSEKKSRKTPSIPARQATPIGR